MAAAGEAAAGTAGATEDPPRKNREWPLPDCPDAAERPVGVPGGVTTDARRADPRPSDVAAAIAAAAAAAAVLELPRGDVGFDAGPASPPL